MAEDEIVQLRARVKALEMAVAVNLMVDAMGRGETDLREFGETRRQVLAAIAQITAEEPDPNPVLAEAMTKFADMLATLTAGLSDQWAEAFRSKRGGAGAGG